MKSYCLDTSGLSNPLENMPEDIHPTLWRRVGAIITEGRISVTTEIYDELTHLRGSIGDCIRDNGKLIRLEIGDEEWNWEAYLAHVNRMKDQHRKFISEYNGNRKRTIGLNDLSIIAMAKTLGLPLVSMELAIPDPQSLSRRIPNICEHEQIEHLTFNDFLRREGFKL